MKNMRGNSKAILGSHYIKKRLESALRVVSELSKENSSVNKLGKYAKTNLSVGKSTDSKTNPNLSVGNSTDSKIKKVLSLWPYYSKEHIRTC